MWCLSSVGRSILNHFLVGKEYIFLKLTIIKLNYWIYGMQQIEGCPFLL